MRHLRKAKLEQIQLTGGVIPNESESGKRDAAPIDFDFGGNTKSLTKKKIASWGRNPDCRKSITAGVGIPVGSKYGNIEAEDKKLSFGDQVTRQAR